LAELEELIFEFSAFDIHDIEFNCGESVNRCVELLEDPGNGLGHSLSLCVSDLNLLELVELHDSACQVHDVLAPLGEGIKSDKERVSGDFPLVL